MPQHTSHFLGIDVGTTAIKASVYSPDGKSVATATRANAVTQDRPGYATQDMKSVWRLCAKCVRDAVESCRQNGIDAESIASIGVCAQGDGLWALDSDLVPNGPALLWNDQRASEQVQAWSADGTADALAAICGTANWPGTSGSLFHWLKQADPERAAATSVVLNCKDWINFQLTGELSTDYCDATIPFMDLQGRTYADKAFSLLGVPELRTAVLDPKPAPSFLGNLIGAAADQLGLAEGIPVAVGSIDVAAMMTGMGINTPGEVSIILGTTAVLGMNVEPHELDGEIVGATLLHPYLPCWIKVLAPQSGASALDWFISQHPKSLTGESIAESAALLSEAAGSSPPGANGVVFLPFLTGERAPFVAPQATGSFLGLHASSTQADMARAVIEGVAFSLRHCYEHANDRAVSRVFVTGGGARNRFFCDVLASVLNAEIVASEASDHGLWGAALYGASAAGKINIEQVEPRAESLTTFRSQKELAAQYDHLFESYVKCIAHVRPTWNLTTQT